MDKRNQKIYKACSLKIGSVYMCDKLIELGVVPRKSLIARFPKLLKLMNIAADGKISRLVIEHKDRLVRFNFNLLKKYFESFGVEVEVVENTLPKSYESELVEDMLSLMSSFSARIYGKRSAENRKKLKQSRTKTK